MRSSNGNSTGAPEAIEFTAGKGADRYEIAPRPTSYSVIARGWAGRIAAAAVVLALVAGPAAACSVCQGDPDSRMAKGAQAGVVALLAITYGLLAGIATIAGVWVVRARRMRVDETPGAPGNDRYS